MNMTGPGNGKPSIHFTWEEAVITTHREIQNILPESLKSAIISTADHLEIVRGILKVPIHILSWYRCPELNTAVGGTPNSQHMQGTAVDFHASEFGSPLLVCKRLARFAGSIIFDQLILEHTWVHISFSATPNGKARREVLTLLQDKTYAVGLTDKFGFPIIV